jgi:hypothetical protein
MKVNSYYSFPDELDMKEFTQEYLNQKEIEKLLEEENIREDDLEEGQKNLYGRSKFLLESNAEYFNYKLQGVVLHEGTTDHGHYTSLIQERQKQGKSAPMWYCFNDTIVTSFDPAFLQSEAFGGQEERYFLILINPI